VLNGAAGTHSMPTKSHATFRGNRQPISLALHEKVQHCDDNLPRASGFASREGTSPSFDYIITRCLFVVRQNQSGYWSFVRSASPGRPPV